MTRYGKKIGLAFQITDDILDLEGEEKVIGKKTHADERKATYPKTLGLKKSKRIAEELIKSAKKDLKAFGKKAFIFEELADFVISRVN